MSRLPISFIPFPHKLYDVRPELDVVYFILGRYGVRIGAHEL